jgi:hypothetical protein
MSLRLACAFSLVSSMLVLGGCGASDDDASSTPGNQVTLRGRVGGGGTTVTPKTFGNVSTDSGSLRVSARELHARGTHGRKVDVAVGPDGSFQVAVARGARWVVTVDDREGESAIVTFGDGESALSVAGDGGSATIDVGNVRIVGGEARSDVLLDGQFGLEATLAHLDEVFETASGAIIAAEQALAEARKAYEEAFKAAEQALSEAERARTEAERAAEEARRAAEEARRAAGGAGAGDDP